MKRKSKGQSMVEFAMVFPMIMVAFFSAIDGGYYIYAWSQVQFAARRGAEQATKLPPRVVSTNPATYQNQTDDPCLQLIRNETNNSGAFNQALQIKNNEMFISFHRTVNTINPDSGQDLRKVGFSIQMRIQRGIEPLTPIGEMLAESGFRFNAVSRRTIVSVAPTIGSTPPVYRTCLGTAP